MDKFLYVHLQTKGRDFYPMLKSMGQRKKDVTPVH